MFGELGDSDIYENNRGGGFDASDADANFAFDTQNDVNATVSDDFLDTFSDAGYAAPSQQAGGQAAPQGGILGSQGQHQQAYNQGVPPAAQTGQRPPQKGQGLLYILILGLLFAGAVGMFFYKKNAEQAAPPEEQAMGDYFYDKAADGSNGDNGAAANAQAAAPQGDVATVDVELTPGVSKAPDKKASAGTEGKDAKAEAPEKTMSAIEKAMAKKKADKEKEGRVGLNNAVVIPVSSGGRPDPFLPYNQQASMAVKPKFDLVAPPMEIPESDPMIDKVFEFKLTGIMYDNIRPSAILSVDGAEQLVHKGDVVMGYKILDITRKTVTVKYKSNTYEVSAGQSIGANVNLNPVSSLSKQFGGAYSEPSKNVIQFNN